MVVMVVRLRLRLGRGHAAVTLALTGYLRSDTLLQALDDTARIVCAAGSTSRLRADTPSRYVTSQLGQLSLASLRGRLIEYQLRLGYGRECHLCRVAGDTV